MDNNISKGIENIKSLRAMYFEELIGEKNKVFEIPLFQRNYSWTENECEKFVDDILIAYKEKKQYYIGNIIDYLSTDTDEKITKYVLIDGQQRITSLLLLLCAMRDSFSKELKNVDNELLLNNDMVEKYRIKLKQNYSDEADFNEIINKNTIEDKKSNIYNAYNKFLKIIDDDKRVNSKTIGNIYSFIKKLEIICIQLKNDDNNIKNVQDIFEKINSTGKPLSPADLIRNFLLFSSSIDEQEELHKYWKKIEEIVGEKKILKFVKAFVILNTFEDVSNEKIYSKFKEKFFSKNHEDILKQLVKYATFFSMIENGKFYELNNKSINNITSKDLNNLQLYDFEKNIGETRYNSLSKLKTTFTLLNYLGTDEMNPFFFQLCDKLYYTDLEKLNDIVELILEFMIRYRIVQPSSGGGSVSSKIRNIMKKVDNKEIKLTPNKLYIALSEKDSDANKYPNNAEFISALRNEILIAHAKVLLYQYARRMKYEIPSFNKNITIEHLMPQTIDSSTSEGKWWIEHLGGSEKWNDIHNNYLNCIGNFALLSRKLNSSVSNSIWDKKREKLLECAADKETQLVAKNKVWNAEKIKSRNNELSNKLSNVITGPYTERKGKNWLNK